MFLNLTRFFVGDQKSLFGTKCSSFRNDTVDLSHLTNISFFWSSGFEKFSNSWKTACDILCLRSLAGSLCNNRTCINSSTFINRNLSTSWNWISSYRISFRVLNYDLWIKVFFVFNDYHWSSSWCISFDLCSNARQHIFKSNDTLFLWKNRNVVRIPLSQQCVFLNIISILEMKQGTRWGRVVVNNSIITIQNLNRTSLIKGNLLSVC